VTAPATTPLVELEGVNKHFGALHVLRDIDLTVARGEVVVVIGPSGSGKSTLCRTINRLETIDTGEIRVDGRPLPLEGKQLAQLRAEVGMVFQSFNLFAHKTVLQNVTLGPVKVRGVKKADAEKRGRELLERVGIASQADKYPAQLSGGQQQRVAIARALANNPTVLLADEPTANLDSGHGREIARLLRRLAEEDGRSIVMVSHDERLREVADRVLWLEDGAFRELAALATDPVCGMAVERDPAMHLQAEGQEWWFCSNACRADFAAHPDRYVDEDPAR